MTSRLPILLLTALFALVCGLAAGAQATMPRHVQVTLIPQSTRIAAGQALPITIEEEIDPGWHTYWLNPGDAGQAPEIRWTLPPGFAAGPVRYPAPVRLLEGPLATYGYEDHATLVQTITAPTVLPPGAVTLTAHIGILVCKDICIPETGDYPVTLNDRTTVDNGAAVAAAQAHIVNETAGKPATFREQGGQLVLTIAPMPEFYHAGMEVELFPADWGLIDNPQAATAAVEDGALVVRQKRGERTLAEVPVFHVLLAVKGKSWRDIRAYDATALDKALPPAGGGLGGGVVPHQAASDFAAAAPPPNPPPAGGRASALMLALFGGLILNLMPCVFPVLSLKALKLVTLSGRERNHARLLSLSYAAGILVAFAALAAVLVALRAGGAKIGWGFQLQDPIFVLPLAWLLFLLGLNLSGAIEISGRFSGAGQKLAAAGGHAGSFFTGLLAAVVATPCTAPFMGVAIGYALTQGPATTVAVFLALGCGLALPFVLLCFVPALQCALPKPGAWMVTFRQLLAFPLYLSAAWLAWVLALQAGETAMLAALAGAVLLAFAAWLLGKGQRVLALLFFLGVIALAPFARHVETHSTPADGADWRPFSALPDALRGKDPVFVDLTAAWCITCKINEAAVLHTSATMALLHARHVATIAGDWTNRDSGISDFLRAHGRAGVPLYLFYPARGADGARPAPVVLPQILTPGLVATVLKEPR